MVDRVSNVAYRSEVVRETGVWRCVVAIAIAIVAVMGWVVFATGWAVPIWTAAMIRKAAELDAELVAALAVLAIVVTASQILERRKAAR